MFIVEHVFNKRKGIDKKQEESNGDDDDDDGNGQGTSKTSETEIVGKAM
jgi:hypothetical protein